MLSYNLDFNSCAIRDGFHKSSHIFDLLIILILTVRVLIIVIVLVAIVYPPQ